MVSSSEHLVVVCKSHLMGRPRIPVQIRCGSILLRFPFCFPLFPFFPFFPFVLYVVWLGQFLPLLKINNPPLCIFYEIQLWSVAILLKRDNSHLSNDSVTTDKTVLSDRSGKWRGAAQAKDNSKPDNARRTSSLRVTIFLFSPFSLIVFLFLYILCLGQFLSLSNMNNPHLPLRMRSTYGQLLSFSGKNNPHLSRDSLIKPRFCLSKLNG